jgi:hypothetical protein
VTDREVIEAIRADHLAANISNRYYVRHHWDRAWVDPGNTMFGLGPYVKLPVDWANSDDPADGTCEVVIRVYAPVRLRRRLAKQWVPDATSAGERERRHGYTQW